jgi:hypothetical protein
MILKWIFKKSDGRGLDWVCFWVEQVTDCCECGNELLAVGWS